MAGNENNDAMYGSLSQEHQLENHPPGMFLTNSMRVGGALTGLLKNDNMVVQMPAPAGMQEVGEQEPSDSTEKWTQAGLDVMRKSIRKRKANSKFDNDDYEVVHHADSSTINNNAAGNEHTHTQDDSCIQESSEYSMADGSSLSGSEQACSSEQRLYPRPALPQLYQPSLEAQGSYDLYEQASQGVVINGELPAHLFSQEPLAASTGLLHAASSNGAQLLRAVASEACWREASQDIEVPTAAAEPQQARLEALLEAPRSRPLLQTPEASLPKASQQLQAAAPLLPPVARQASQVAPLGAPLVAAPGELIVLVAKLLTKSDVIKKRIILPRASVESSMFFLRAYKKFPMCMLDRHGFEWPLEISSWANGTVFRRVYVLERTDPYVQKFNLQVGDSVGICVDSAGRLVLECKTPGICSAVDIAGTAKLELRQLPTPEPGQAITLADDEPRACTRHANCTKMAGHTGFCGVSRQHGPETVLQPRSNTRTERPVSARRGTSNGGEEQSALPRMASHTAAGGGAGSAVPPRVTSQQAAASALSDLTSRAGMVAGARSKVASFLEGPSCQVSLGSTPKSAPSAGQTSGSCPRSGTGPSRGQARRVRAIWVPAPKPAANPDPSVMRRQGKRQMLASASQEQLVEAGSREKQPSRVPRAGPMGERRALLSGADKMDVDSGADSSNSGPAASSVRQFRIRVKCGMVSGSYDIRQGTIKMSSLDQEACTFTPTEFATEFGGRQGESCKDWRNAIFVDLQPEHGERMGPLAPVPVGAWLQSKGITVNATGRSISAMGNEELQDAAQAGQLASFPAPAAPLVKNENLERLSPRRHCLPASRFAPDEIPRRAPRPVGSRRAGGSGAVRGRPTKASLARKVLGAAPAKQQKGHKPVAQKQGYDSGDEFAANLLLSLQGKPPASDGGFCGRATHVMHAPSARPSNNVYY